MTDPMKIADEIERLINDDTVYYPSLYEAPLRSAVEALRGMGAPSQATPSSPIVTEAMIEAGYKACNNYISGPWTSVYRDIYLAMRKAES